MSLRELTIIVVLYNKKIEESETLNSLLEFECSGSKIIIHNNGPEEIVVTDYWKKIFESKFFSFDFVNCVQNKPLSILYNEYIANEKDSKRFIILDDDTILNLAVIQRALTLDCHLELPKIISTNDGKPYYPLLKGKVIGVNNTQLNASDVVSIGSGLIINYKLIELFEKHAIQLFDESFALYGVDSSFFRKLSVISKTEKIIVSSNTYINHSLSRVEKKQAIYESKERIIDIAISFRRYPSKHLTYVFFIMVFKNIIDLNFSNIKMIMGLMIKPVHPRIVTWRSRNKQKNYGLSNK